MSGDEKQRQDWQPAIELNPEQLRDLPNTEEAAVEQVDSGEDKKDTDKSEKNAGLSRIFVAISALLVKLIIIVECYRLVSWGYQQHWSLGTLLSLLIVSVLVMAIVLALRALKGMRQLRRRQPLQQRASQMIASNQYKQAAPLLDEMAEQLKGTALVVPLQQCINEVDSVYRDGEVIRFVSNHGFVEADRKAIDKISRCSFDTAALVAVSPFASFDILLAAWRNWRMLNSIADCYGIAPGIAGQWRLLRQVLHNLAFVGLSELAIDNSGTLLTGSVTGQLTARIGQGLGAGLVTARIGLEAVKLCRPLPFDEGNKPKLSQIQSSLLKELKSKF
ncbi:MAG: TIGR01620 family protein [Motiliproteus sp.]|nr:TIGR01620 family protein [Motiliproteus sp.]MCW9051661.1 TIGR01620 family protein [Motiliproteus sp.]